MTGDKDSHGLAAGADRAAQPAENAHARLRTGPIHWLLFNSTCVAALVSLVWLAPVIPLPGLLRGAAFLVSALLIPLALVLVPALLLRHIPHKKPPKLAIVALIVAVVASVVLAVITRQAGNERALQERGRWAEAVVIEVENRKTDKCTLRTRDGRKISPQLSEGDGCEADWVEPGDKLRVLYDPKGAAGPVEDVDGELEPGSYRGAVGGLAALITVAGTLGCARLNRRGNE
ncbi:hypothetical protein ACFUTR_33455 [Streptomyces sp. NPDC057367]|uniref:hypothetical protein n=1 Tax=Streptomyces sp. NPDC057367 TaxID=3346108 RepID=UPI003630D838